MSTSSSQSRLSGAKGKPLKKPANKLAKVFTGNDVAYEFTMAELVAAKTKFHIVGYHHNLSLFDIMAVETGPDELFRLQEEIFEAVQEKVDFSEKPRTNWVVLAPKKDTKVYHRCLIAGFENKNRYARVVYIDSGGTGVVKGSKLKPVNDEIMKFPRLSYGVFLDDMFPVSNYILWDDFARLIKSHEKTEFSVELGTPLDVAGSLYCKNKVKLSYQKSMNQMVDIREEIKELEKWEWEKFSNLTGKDDELCDKGKYGTQFRTVLLKCFPTPYPLEVKDRFPATVSRIISEGNDRDVALLYVNLLTLPTYFNCFNVLHHQMDRYAEHITRTAFFPTIGEPLMFRLINKENIPKAENIKFPVLRWFRALRLSTDMLYLLDIDEMVPFNALEYDDYELRRCYSEFFKVPALFFVARPKNKDGYLTVAQAKEIFKPGSRFNFTITKEREDNSAHSPYEATYSKVEGREEGITLDAFLVTHAPQPN